MNNSMIEKAKDAAHAATVATHDRESCQRDGDFLYVDGAVDLDAVVRAVLSAIREPNEAMRNEARDWAYAKYGKPVGRDGTDGCWQAQIDAILKEGT